MSSIQDELNQDVTNLQSAKVAMGWALEKAEGLSLSIQSLKEQLEQKNHEIKFLQNQNIELQKNIQQTEFEKSSLLQKMQSFQDEITTLLVQISEKEKEKLGMQRKQLEEAISLERNFEGIRAKLLQEKESELRKLNVAKEDEIKKLTLEWNNETNRLKEELLEKESGFRQREREQIQEFQNWKNQIFQEYAQKQMQLSFEYSKKELALKSSAGLELHQSIQKLQQEKADLEKHLLQEAENFHRELSKKQEEFSQQLDEQSSHWTKIVSTRDEFFKEEMEKTLARIRDEFSKKEKIWQDEKQKLESKISQLPDESELSKNQELLKELELKVKGLSNQKEYLSKFNQMLLERKGTLETEFSQFLNHVSNLKSKNESDTSLQHGQVPTEATAPLPEDPASGKIGFFSFSFPTFKRLLK